jgi:hypothetical protein
MHIAGYVFLSRTLLHPFWGFNRYFGLGVCFLTHPSQIKLFSLTAYLCIDRHRSYNLGYFVPDIHCFESLGDAYPPGV